MYVTSAGNTPLSPTPIDYLPEGATAQWFVIPEGHDQGKRMFFYVREPKETSPVGTILFVHGNPESSLTYRGIIDRLIDSSTPLRIIAMDHIGFGLSDQADFEMVEMHHARNLSQLVQALGLRNITLVIHDWGGAIGTGAFLDMQDRVSQLVLMNTTVFPMPSQGLVYNRFPVPYIMGWTWLGRLVPDFLWPWLPPMVMFSPGNQFDFVFRHIPSFYWRALLGRLTPKELIYRDMFIPKMNSRSSRRQVKQTQVWGHGYKYKDQKHGWQDNHDYYHRLQNELMPMWSERKIPTRAFFGLWDPCGKDEVQDQWLLALPQLAGNITSFPGVGHFVEEHRPEEIARGILSLFANPQE